MRKITLLAAAAAFAPALLAGSVAMAQEPPAPEAMPMAAPHHHHRHHHHHASSHASAATGERPIDHGPNTAEANGAYQGGGVILQGAPGAPAPTPRGTPPGEVPVGSVPR